MTDAQPSLELLIDFVEGLLPAEACERVAALMESDEVVRMQVAGIVSYREAHGSTDGFLEELEQRPLPEAMEEADVRQIKPRWLFLVAAAAVALVLGWQFWPASTSFESQMAMASTKHFPIDAQTRGTTGEAAAAAYNSQDYATALSIYQDAEKETLRADQLLQAGCAAIQLQQPHVALRFLEPALTDHPVVGRDAMWFRALALVQTERYSESLALIDVLASSSGAWSAEASDLLNNWPDQH